MEDLRISLAAARVNANMTQSELARKLGVSKTTIHNWERGETSPGLKHLREISELSHIPINYIFLPETLLKVEDKDRAG